MERKRERGGRERETTAEKERRLLCSNSKEHSRRTRAPSADPPPSPFCLSILSSSAKGALQRDENLAGYR